MPDWVIEFDDDDGGSIHPSNVGSMILVSPRGISKSSNYYYYYKKEHIISWRILHSVGLTATIVFQPISSEISEDGHVGENEEVMMIRWMCRLIIAKKSMRELLTLA